MANLIGMTLGQYKITVLLGETERAEVYRARQEALRRDVAIKVIRPQLTSTSIFLQRFQRETQIVATLQHPHIMRIYDYGEQQGIPYLVMDYLTGGSLDDLIKRERSFTPTEVSLILDQIAAALDYAHRRGILHCDLKPSNILFDESGSAILTDFCITKLTTDADVPTATGLVIGIPAYMAPEQWQGLLIDARTDVYAMGVIVYEMLTGHVPHTGTSPVTIMHRALTEQPPPLATYRSDLSEAVEAVIQKALAKTQEGRYQTAGELATAFRLTLPSVKASAQPHQNVAYEDERTHVVGRQTPPKPAMEYSTAIGQAPQRNTEYMDLRAAPSSKSEVNFTVFYPRTVQVSTGYGLYLYAHIPSALPAVQTDAKRFTHELGGSVPAPRTAKEHAQIEQRQLVTITPTCEGLTFDPPTLTKRWYMPFTRYEFDLRSSVEYIDRNLQGRVSVAIAGIEIAHVDFGIEVVATDAIPQPMPVNMTTTSVKPNPLAVAKNLMQTASAKIYDKIFISYSRKDKLVAESYRLAQLALGNDVFMDTYSIRTGADWRVALAQAIDNADIFQLFWSENAAASENVHDEWDYALHFRCPESHCAEFIRPVYWKAPIPVPPPAELKHLNFRYVPLANSAPRLSDLLAWIQTQINRLFTGQR